MSKTKDQSHRKSALEKNLVTNLKYRGGLRDSAILFFKRTHLGETALFKNTVGICQGARDDFRTKINS